MDGSLSDLKDHIFNSIINLFIKISLTEKIAARHHLEQALCAFEDDFRLGNIERIEFALPDCKQMQKTIEIHKVIIWCKDSPDLYTIVKKLLRNMKILLMSSEIFSIMFSFAPSFPVRFILAGQSTN